MTRSKPTTKATKPARGKVAPKQSAVAPVDELALLVADWQAICGTDAEQVLTDAEHFIVDRLAPMAARLVREHPTVFVDPGNPPRLAPIETRGEFVAELLTSAASAVAAGRRLIFWLAAITDPVLCERSVPTDRDSLREWAVGWSIFAEPDPERPGCVRVRTWHQPVEWFAMAARQARAVPVSNGGEFQHDCEWHESEDYKLVQWCGHTIKLTENQRLIFKVVHSQYLKGNTWVTLDYVRSQAGFDKATRLDKYFINDPKIDVLTGLDKEKTNYVNGWQTMLRYDKVSHLFSFNPTDDRGAAGNKS